MNKGDFQAYESYYLYRFKQYLSSVGYYIQNQRLKKIIYKG